MKQVIVNKQQQQQQKQQVASVSRKKILQAENKATTMVIVRNINYGLGHMLILIYYCFLIEPSVLKTCVQKLAVVPFYVSYATPLFLYYFNKTFKIQANRLFKCLVPCFKWVNFDASHKIIYVTFFLISIFLYYILYLVYNYILNEINQ